MSHKTLVMVTFLTLIGLAGVGAGGFAQETGDDPPTVRFDPLTGEPLEVPPPPPPEEEPVADLSKANDLVRAGDYAAANEELAALQEQFPDDPRLLFMRGEVVLSLSKPADALPLLRRAIELDGERPRAHFQLAMALLRTGDAEGALASFAKEIEVNEDTDVRIMSRLNRTQILAQTRKWDEAAAELEAVAELDPGRVEVYGDIAGFWLEAGDLKQAERSLEAGAEKGFESARHHYIVGTRYYGKKQYEEAAAAYRRALDIDSRLAEAERGLGGALDQLDQESEAVAHLKRYLQLKPEAPDASRVKERIQEIEGG